MSQDPPATLDEPDTDDEVIAKLRAEVARRDAAGVDLSRQVMALQAEIAQMRRSHDKLLAVLYSIERTANQAAALAAKNTKP